MRSRILGTIYAQPFLRTQGKGVLFILWVMIMISLGVDELAAAIDDELFGLGGHDFTPYGQAAVAYESREPELVLSGPAGTGKSRVLLEKIHRDMLAYPGARALIVRQTRHSLSETTLVTFERDVLGDGHPLLSGMSGRQLDRTNRSHYQYPNGSRIVLGGMDKPTKVLSSEYDLIYVPECIELHLTSWEVLGTRLRNGVMPYQQILGDTNPDSQQHWVYQRFEAGLLRMLFCLHEDNPLLFNHATGEWTQRGREYVFGVLGRLTGVRYLRYREGKWVNSEGAVYEDWNPAIHYIDRFPIPDTWRRIRVIDWGYTNPFVCLWIAIDPDGRMYVYRQIYMTQRTVKRHTEQIKVLTGRERIEASVADHDAEDRATMHENGVQTIPAKKDIRLGIEKVQDRLLIADDGKPRLFVLRDSLVEMDETLQTAGLPVSIEGEFVSYMYPKGIDGKPKKEEPVDLYNHGLDALRYGVMYVDKGRQVGRQVKVQYVKKTRR